MQNPICRRQFVKTFTLGTAFSTLFGKSWQASVLADITQSTVGLLRVKLSDYPALLEEYGSVRLGINPIEYSGPLGFFYPILINHHYDDVYYALDTACRHAGCVVPQYVSLMEGEPSIGGIYCPCHGSGYWIDGRLLNGPALSGLIQYPISFDGAETLTVEVPNLGYCVNSTLVQSMETPKLRLDFPTFENVEYEVRFREKVTDEWSVVPFALSVDDLAEQLSIVADGSPSAVFVNRTTSTGFYGVAIKLLNLTYTGEDE